MKKKTHTHIHDSSDETITVCLLPSIKLKESIYGETLYLLWTWDYSYYQSFVFHSTVHIFVSRYKILDKPNSYNWFEKQSSKAIM